jgi:hypothetical protein
MPPRASKTTPMVMMTAVVTHFPKDILTSLFFSLQENAPRNPEPAVDGIVLERGVIHEPAIETQAGTFTKQGRSTDCQFLLIEDITDSHHVIHLAIAVVEEAVTRRWSFGDGLAVASRTQRRL